MLFVRCLAKQLEINKISVMADLNLIHDVNNGKLSR